MWWRLTTSITCYKTISKTTTQETSMGQITSLTLCRLCVWPQLSTILQRWMTVRLLGVRLSTLPQSHCSLNPAEWIRSLLYDQSSSGHPVKDLVLRTTRRLRRLGCYAALSASLTGVHLLGALLKIQRVDNIYSLIAFSKDSRG